MKSNKCPIHNMYMIIYTKVDCAPMLQKGIHFYAIYHQIGSEI